jgi:hypothetical protein
MWMIGCWSYYECHKVTDGIGTSPLFSFSVKKAIASIFRRQAISTAWNSSRSRAIPHSVCQNTTTHKTTHFFQRHISILCWRSFVYLLLFLHDSQTKCQKRTYNWKTVMFDLTFHLRKIMVEKINILLGDIHYLSSTKFNLTHVRKKIAPKLFQTPELFCDFTQRIPVVSYQVSGQLMASIFKGLGVSLPFEMGPICCPKTSARNYHFNLRKIPKLPRSHWFMFLISYTFFILHYMTLLIRYFIAAKLTHKIKEYWRFNFSAMLQCVD